MLRIFVFILLMIPVCVFAQLNNYWSQNFNDESSLLAGAVVGGGAGASSIFYNPATISEIKQSKLSLNASLFSFDFLKASNAWGEGLDYHDTRSYITPRFLSYMLKPRKWNSWSFEVAILNVANLESENAVYVDKDIDILKNIEGTENYTAAGLIKNRYRDDWVGCGGSFQLNESWSFGSSMFISFLIQSSFYKIALDARPEINRYHSATSTYQIASFSEEEMLKYNDYRLLWKMGFVYSKARFSLGINITTPVISGIYSDGKHLQRRRSQSNISDPETGDPMKDYLIVDYAEKKDVSIHSRTPLSIAAGINILNADQTGIFYSAMEFFTPVHPYALASARNKKIISNFNQLTPLEQDEWLTFVSGARQVLNFAFGYKKYVKNNFMILAGFKTDFNYRKNYDLSPYTSEFAVKNLNYNKFHFTAGSTLLVFGQDITAGIQYTFGRLQDQKQIVNLSDPVEFNTQEMKPLQGTRMNIMNTLSNSISIYLAATFNFEHSDK